MGKGNRAGADRAEKVFVGCRDVFTELINGLVYEGKVVLREEAILPGPTESIYRGEAKAKQDSDLKVGSTSETNTGWKQEEEVGHNAGQGKVLDCRKNALFEMKNQFRDVSMYEIEDGKVQALYNLENQSTVDRRMPLRCAGYDGAAYRSQYREKKEQGVYPVISIVLNWGEKPWDAARSVREMVGCFRKEELDDYIDKNRIHVFDMRFLPMEVRERFQGDMRVILDYLSDRESLLRRRQKLKNPEEVMLMLYALSKDARYLESIEFMGEGEEKSMCDLLDEAENRGMARGIVRGREEGMARGREEGMARGREQGLRRGIQVLITTCHEVGLSMEATIQKLKEKYELDEAEARKDINLYWK